MVEPSEQFDRKNAENTEAAAAEGEEAAAAVAEEIQKKLDNGTYNEDEANALQLRALADKANPNTKTNQSILGEMGNVFGEGVKNFANGINSVFSDVLKTVTGGSDGKGGTDANIDVTTEEEGGTTNSTKKTVDANTDPGEVQNNLLDTITDALGKDLTKLGKINKITITTAKGVRVEIDINKMGDEITKNTPNLPTSTQQSVDNKAQEISANINSTTTPEEVANQAEAAADSVASESEVESAVEEANNKGADSTEVNKTPQDPNKNSNWAKAWILTKILGALAMAGVPTGIVLWAIISKCKELTGCYKVSGSTKGPIKQKIMCKGSDSYSRKYCNCYDSTKSNKDCKKDVCKCYPDQPQGNPAKAKFPTCNTTDPNAYVYYDYIVCTPLDAIASIISDAVDFFADSGSSLFSKVLKWGLIILGSMLGLLLIYSLIRVLATKEIEKLTK